MTFAVSLVVKATLVLVAGLAAASLFRRAPASIRHVILAATFGALISLPLYETFGPSASFIVPIEIPLSQPSATLQPATAATAAATATVTLGDATNGIGLPSLGAIIVGVWALGALLLIGSLLLALRRLNRLTRSGLPWLDAQPLATTLATEAGVRRRVGIVLHEDVDVPLTWGFRHSVIVLPMDAREWGDADVRRALLHELEHVYRGDWFVQLAARTVRAVYWFHPLVWMAMRKLSLEAERACDDAVIRSADRTAYAHQLVSLAERLQGARRFVVPAMACRSDLSTRVRALLDERQKRGRPRPLPHALVIAVMSVTVLTIGPVRAVEQTPAEALGPELHEAPWAPVVRALFGATDFGENASNRLGLELIEAAEEGDVDRINDLVAAGVDVNVAVYGDGSPLIAAARSGHLDAVQLLLDRGADVNMLVPGDGNPLIMAAREGHTEVVELLLSRGAIVDTIVDGDENALIQASGAGRLAAVQLLVNRGANVNARVWAARSADRAGEWRTPLSMATRGRHSAVVTYLRSVGAQE